MCGEEKREKFWWCRASEFGLIVDCVFWWTIKRLCWWSVINKFWYSEAYVLRKKRKKRERREVNKINERRRDIPQSKQKRRSHVLKLQLYFRLIYVQACKSNRMWSCAEFTNKRFAAMYIYLPTGGSEGSLQRCNSIGLVALLSL